jgi:hypothetical protein
MLGRFFVVSACAKPINGNATNAVINIIFCLLIVVALCSYYRA